MPKLMSTYGFVAPSPPPPPPPNECIDCRVSLCEEGRTRMFGVTEDECKRVEDVALEEVELIDTLVNGTDMPACVDVRAAPRS